MKVAQSAKGNSSLKMKPTN